MMGSLWLQHYTVTWGYSGPAQANKSTSTHTLVGPCSTLLNCDLLSHYTSLTSRLGFWLKQYWLLWYKRRADWWIDQLAESYSKKWHQQVESVAASSCQPVKSRSTCQRCLTAAFYHLISLDRGDGGGGVKRRVRCEGTWSFMLHCWTQTMCHLDSAATKM